MKKEELGSGRHLEREEGRESERARERFDQAQAMLGRLLHGALGHAVRADERNLYGVLESQLPHKTVNLIF